MARPSKNNPNGEQTKPKMTPEVLADMKKAFSLGCSNEEVMLYCKISSTTLYRWFDEHPQLKEEMELQKEMATLQARQSLMNGITGKKDAKGEWLIMPDATLALNYLRYKKNKEFSLGSEGTLSVTSIVRVIKPALLPGEEESVVQAQITAEKRDEEESDE